MTQRHVIGRPPDFVCIGAQKAGTSWLYNALYEASGVFLSVVKELSYFVESDPRDRAWATVLRHNQTTLVRNLLKPPALPVPNLEEIRAQLDHIGSPQLVDDDWYTGIFSLFARPDDLCGDISPLYMTLRQDQIDHLMALNPAVRVLVIVRDPVDRAWSQIQMRIRNGKMDDDLDQLAGDQRALESFASFSDYQGALTRWRASAGEGCFHAIAFDRIASEPESVFEEVGEFLGIEALQTSVDLHAPVNTGSGRPMPMPLSLRAILFDQLKPQYAYLCGLFPGLADRWEQRHTNALNECV
ncbi:MAG: sulfotransferase family protein [Phycisphaerales bacterium]